MPPLLDIYALTSQRDVLMIDQFLDEYVDREASEDRGDEELMIMSLPTKVGTDDHGFVWEPARSLTHIIERALAYPRRAFAVYLVSKRPGIDRVILGFTEDNQVVLGLSIDDEGMKPENEREARSLLQRLGAQHPCRLGLVLVEEPPPLSEERFRLAGTGERAVYFAEFPEGRA